jgi:hypothetical protein
MAPELAAKAGTDDISAGHRPAGGCQSSTLFPRHKGIAFGDAANASNSLHGTSRIIRTQPFYAWYSCGRGLRSQPKSQDSRLTASAPITAAPNEDTVNPGTSAEAMAKAAPFTTK